MVRRIYVEKKPALRHEAGALLGELRTLLGISSLAGLRLINRYDVEGLDEDAFRRAVKTVFSEPQVDDVSEQLPAGDHTAFAVEYLPGQFDQRADSASQCIQLMTQGERPAVRTARVFLLSGSLSEEDVEKIKRYLINPVEAREASLEPVETLRMEYDLPTGVSLVEGFISMDDAALEKLLDTLGLAMDLDDLRFLQAHFRDEEKRDPTITEVRVVDTYWSDHCRHTTFSTHIDSVEILDEETLAAYRRYLDARVEVYGEQKAAARPQTLMDMATIAAKTLKKRGLLGNMDQSEEINACSIHVTATVNGEEQDWLLMFKNETHNHPTEIEPFGGAATCIGGCIRDPLSGRAYVYQAMRVTGCGDPRTPVSETIPGKLPQRKLAQTAAAGYSSYGNQIGLATGMVSEVYHQGYVAKHLEVGAVVAAAPADNVVRERPAPGDVVILLGGRTGRDGIGGATGSSKSHNRKSLVTMASEVQKGNAPEERKIQRLFRDGNVTRLIKRCNDFGAGGVSVAIGELAPGLEIRLDAVRKKYEGLDGTELAISESQERMACVVAAKDAAAFIAAAEKENLEAYQVAEVTQAPRMVMTWQGRTIVNLSRAFLDTNGASKHTCVKVEAKDRSAMDAPAASSLRETASSLKCASRRGLAERFDSTIGAGSVLMPFGGVRQRTPAQAMAALLPVLPGQETEDCSVMAWGFDADQMSIDPYRGAYRSVVTSVARLVAAGCDYRKAYLSLQEYFEKLRDEPERWGKPFSALLGALDAQLGLGVAAIGGKDSMSGSFLDMDVPPTLISFAIAPARAGDILSPEFKKAGNPVYLFAPESEDAEKLKACWDGFAALREKGVVKAAWAVENSVAEAVMNMSFGNGTGFAACADEAWYSPMPGAIVAELSAPAPFGRKIGSTTADGMVNLGADSASIDELLALNEGVLEGIYPSRTETDAAPVPVISSDKAPVAVPRVGVARPRVLIPVFPGTNCEYDTARAFERAGAVASTFIIRNQSASNIEESAKELIKAIEQTQIIAFPGGFSGGDEPDGSGKFIATTFRNPAIAEAVMKMLYERDGLALGICNGFQALIKLGLVPFGDIREQTADAPTLTFNNISRHVSTITRIRVATNKSPWLYGVHVDDVFNVPVSHGEGKFVASAEQLQKLIDNGQVATQYVDLQNNATMVSPFNPNGSMMGIEGIISPDGRVLGKMGHSERRDDDLYKNVPGNYDMKIFESGVKYFS